MTQHKHIINKQIIEIQLPKKADAFGVQQTLGKLYSEQFTPIIDKLLCDHYGSDEKKRYQIDTLTVDLGTVHIENIAAVFTEKFKDALLAIEDPEDEDNVIEKKVEKSQKTSLQVVSYYLKNGRLPWWSNKTSKSYVLEQLDRLIITPDATFTKLLSQLPLNHVYLNRFIYTFTEEQILLCLQGLTDISIQGLSTIKKELQDSLHKRLEVSNFNIENTFWGAVFTNVAVAKDYEDLKNRCIQQTLLVLGIDQKNGNKKNQDVSLIRSLVKKYQIQYAAEKAWQQLFQHVLKVINHPSFYLIDAGLLQEFKQSLTLEKTENNRQSIVGHLHVFEAVLKPMQSAAKHTVIEKIQSNFEDTDFITIQNAGLVLLWPFLQRFFENLELMDGKEFHDEKAREKAICALHHLCGNEETALFEGLLSLNKVLCGASLEDTVSLIHFSEEEKKMGDDLLQAVIDKGPHWTNLSRDGFQASYLCRQGSLRVRDGHWLLQVKKETYDITLEKLPWSINTIRLPWMNEIILVEWN